jgi:hypothetical protein
MNDFNLKTLQTILLFIALLALCFLMFGCMSNANQESIDECHYEFWHDLRIKICND